MNIDTIYNLYNMLRQDDLSFIHYGILEQSMQDNLLNFSDYYIENKKELSRLKKKISFLMVESFQNIIRHGNSEQITEKTSGNTTGIFFTRNINNTFFITSGNLVEKTTMDSLQEKLNHINQLNDDELKTLYLELMNNGSFSSKGGAGLGLIEMARRSDEKLEFDFEKYTDELCYFYLQLKLISKLNEKVESPQIPITMAQEFRQLMSKEDILMIYKGDFSQDSILPLIKVIEQNLMHETNMSSKKKLIFITLIEVLQNIRKHSKTHNGHRDGIFIIGKKNGRYQIAAGNLVDAKKFSIFKNYLTEINNLTHQQLSELYREKLTQGESTILGGAGLGLIDIARICNNNFTYKFFNEDNDTKFFTINLEI